MNKKTKKGFTLVELLVVIAILAILATVSVVGYTSFINKANMSVDQQAVEQINNYLQAYELSDGKPANINATIDALAEGDLNIKDYVPLTKDTYFFWISSLNRVVHVQADNTIIFPEDITEKNGWYSLSGTIAASEDWDVTGTTATISNGAEFYDFLTKYEEGNNDATGVNEVVLSGKVDLQGAVVSISKVSSELVIKGDADNPALLTGLRNDSAGYIGKNQDDVVTGYHHGLLGVVEEDVTIENVIIDGANVYDTEWSSQFGFFAGSVQNGATLTINNCQVINSTISGAQKVAVLVGQIQDGGKVICNNVTVKNCIVNGDYQSAQLVGYINNEAGCSFTYTNLTVENVTVNQTHNFVGEDRVISSADSTYLWFGQTTEDAYYMNYAGVTNNYYWAPSTEAKVNTNYFPTNQQATDGKTIYVCDNVPGNANITIE